MIKNGIGKDKRPYYHDFIEEMLAKGRNMKKKKIIKFLTDNMQLVRKNQVMNEKCLHFIEKQLSSSSSMENMPRMQALK